MIEATVISYLNSTLDYPAYSEVPKEPPLRFVVVEKTGSSRSRRIDTATLVVQSYAESMYEAAVLNESVKEAMDNLVELDEVSASRLNSDYNYTDESMKKYRYQAVYAVTYY